jgi:acetolactate synthase I/II/III large subunit
MSFSVTGAEALLRSLAAHGVDTCFMNPGTSEMQFVSALDRVSGVRGVLCLDEGVAAGAADGYFRIAARPAATLLHLGPGLANALSNLHNARKARSGIVNIVGEHATWHLAYDAPLTADIEAIAWPFSGFVATARSAADVAPLAAQAIAAARSGEVATLIIPADASWDPCSPDIPPLPAPPTPTVGPATPIAGPLSAVTGFLLSGPALAEPVLQIAARLHHATGASIFANRYSPRLPRGQGVFPVQRLAYFPEPAEAMLAGLDLLYTVETHVPVTFFGYPGRTSTIAPPHCRVQPLSLPAFLDLALSYSPAPEPSIEPPPPAPNSDHALTPELIGDILAALLPPGAILSDEMISSGEAVNGRLARAAAHDLLPVTGGSIGQGLPVALGAAIAAPTRPVFALQADGSAMYTLPALWSFARENANITTIIFANRRYRILDVEIERTRSATPGPRARRMLDLSDPHLDFVHLAQGHGVSATRAHTAAEFAQQLTNALHSPGPKLIEAVLNDPATLRLPT